MHPGRRNYGNRFWLDTKTVRAPLDDYSQRPHAGLIPLRTRFAQISLVRAIPIAIESVGCYLGRVVGRVTESSIGFAFGSNAEKRPSGALVNPCHLKLRHSLPVELVHHSVRVARRVQRFVTRRTGAVVVHAQTSAVRGRRCRRPTAVGAAAVVCAVRCTVCCNVVRYVVTLHCCAGTILDGGRCRQPAAVGAARAAASGARTRTRTRACVNSGLSV
jgi:hypothetical protein